MKVVIQRVNEAFVEVEKETVGKIKKGYLLLIGISKEDSEEDVAYAVKKIINLRVFEDEEGKMNLSLAEVNGSILSISQFTLLASTKKGNRPSFVEAADPQKAEELYESINNQLKEAGFPVQKGIFGANMQIHLINDGPVTIMLDTKNK